MKEDILDLVYHEALMKVVPEMNVLRTDQLMRAKVISSLVAAMPALELDEAGQERYHQRMAEQLADLEGDELMYNRIMSIPAAAAMTLAFKHWDLGAPVYVIGPRLRSMFERTKLDGVVQQDFHLPYSTLYLALPDCPHDIWGGRVRHKTIGVFVHHNSVIGDDGEHIDGLFLIIVGEDISAAHEFGDDSLRTLPLRLDHPIESQCQRPTFYDASAKHSNEEHRAKDLETMNVVSRIAVNALLYLSSSLPAEETDESRRRLEKRAKLLRRTGKKAKKAHSIAAKTSPVSVVWLGRSVESSPAQGGSHASPRQHWVRGHWHHYRHGPGRTLTKLNWVKPFLRGDPNRGRTEARIHHTEEQSC